ncbi:MAG: dTMP kinase [Acidobacteriota bacterium]|nr:dTMP kinase [Acidobacteriota bacterium]
MTTTGKLIAIEGIDGSGKRTQVELLNAALAARGQQTYVTGFPIYDSWFGKMVGEFLNGEYGPLEEVDPHFTALLYAGDRFEAKEQITEALAAGKIVLADRYIGSNMAHQTARVPGEERSDFIKWIEHLEYQIYGLPRENLVIYLRVPPAEAQKLVAQKTARAYTAATHDIQEENLRHLQDAAEMYDELAKRGNWISVQCFDATYQAMRPPELIAAEIATALEPILAAMHGEKA